MGTWVGVEATGMELPGTHEKQSLMIGCGREEKGQRNE